MEEHLIDLQTRLAFQEDSIEALSRAVARQDGEIRQLQAELETLKQQLRALAPFNIASEAEETPPPHY